MSIIYTYKDSTRHNVIQSTATSVTPFCVEGVSGQTADLTAWMDSSSATVARVGPTGNITALTLNSTVSTGSAPISVSSTTVCTNLNADTVDGLHSSSFPLLIASSSSRNVIQPISASVVPLVIQGATSQSADLLQIKDSGGTARLYFNLDIYSRS